jgi:homoserine dehydrogenase
MSQLRSGQKRKRVALAGLGVVGGGVYERLRREPDRYEVVGIICRNPARLADVGAPVSLFTRDVEALAPFDILVEAIGGLAPAGDIVLAALARGADVVTANKTLVSRRFAAIEAAAAESGAEVLYSAAVGGGVPMLETVDEIARRRDIVGLEAVINGTTNFVLDRLGAGASLDEAIREAQVAGFAEADPSADIDGVDAAEKLALLARRAFDANIDPATIERDRLTAVPAQEIAAAARDKAPFKQVASAVIVADKLQLSVRLRQAEADSPLAAPRREENCLVIACADGHRRVLHGKGAGREPTSESVFSDIDRLARGAGAAAHGETVVNASGRVNDSARAPLR